MRLSAPSVGSPKRSDVSAHRLGPMYQQSEKTIQHAVVTMFRAAGCKVFPLSQPRRTMQAEGLADLYVLCPRRRAAFWFETKSAHGRQRPKQEDFERDCVASGVRYVLGGVEEAKEMLKELALTKEPGA